MDILAKPITAYNVQNKRTRYQHTVYNGSRVDVDSGNKTLHAFDTLNFGLRVMGDCHEVARRISHTGWFCDNYENEKCIGVVYRLPARRGKNLFVVGYRLDECEKAGVSFARYYKDEVEAAYAADGMAEKVAEKQQEEATKCDAEQYIETLREDLVEVRSNIRNAVGDIRNGAKTACKYLRSELERRTDIIRGIRELTDSPWMVTEYR